MDKTIKAYYSKELEYSQLAELHTAVLQAALSVNKRLLQLIFDKYKFFEHCLSLKRYLLLGQGDFIQYLMDLLGYLYIVTLSMFTHTAIRSEELSRPASGIYRHNLIGVLETAVRGSNAQYDDPDVLGRLDVRLLEVKSGNHGNGGECGWDVFSLDYHVDVPINTVFTPAAMATYLKIFNFLWRIKRVEFNLSHTWRRHMNMQHAANVTAETRQQLHQCHTLRHEMVQFIYNLQYYLMFEVLECSWEELTQQLKHSVHDFDQLIAAHAEYLNKIVEKSLLSSEALLQILNNTLDVILRFCSTQELLYFASLEEATKRAKKQQLLRQRELEGRWGIDEDEENYSENPLETSVYQFPTELQTQLITIAKEYEATLQSFTLALSKQHDENLKFLIARSDFNEFYERKLRKPLSTALPVDEDDDDDDDGDDTYWLSLSMYSNIFLFKINDVM